METKETKKRTQKDIELDIRVYNLEKEYVNNKYLKNEKRLCYEREYEISSIMKRFQSDKKELLEKKKLLQEKNDTIYPDLPKNEDIFYKTKCEMSAIDYEIKIKNQEANVAMEAVKELYYDKLKKNTADHQRETEYIIIKLNDLTKELYDLFANENKENAETAPFDENDCDGQGKD